MHSSSFDTTDVNNKDGGEVLVGIATLVTEGRIPAKLNSKTKKFYEGPHCTTLTNKVNEHKCDLADALCMKFTNNRDTVLQLWRKNIPICIEVLLSCVCNDDGNNGTGNNLTTDTLDSGFLLEQWHFDVNFRRNTEPLFFNLHQLISAIRSQLYFSQITAWLTTNDETVTFNINKYKLSYRLTIPGETYETTKFTISAIKHDFPITDIGNGLTLKVSFLSLPRMCTIPNISCRKCTPKQQPVQQQEQQEPPSTPPENSFLKLQEKMDLKSGDLVDDRMHTSCTMKGKHRCEDYEEFDSNNVKMEHHLANFKRLCQSSKKINGPEPSTSHSRPKLKVNIDAAYAEINQLKPGKMEKRNISPNDEQIVKSVKLDLTDDKTIWAKTFNCHTNKNDLNKGQLLLDAIERSGQKSTNCNNGVHDEFDGISDKICVQSDRSYCCANKKKDDSDMAKCDNMSDSDIFSIKQKNNFNIYVDNNYCDSPMPALKRLQQKQQSAKRLQDVSNINLLKGVHRVGARQKLTFDDDDADDKDNSETTNSCDKKDISKNCNENNNIPTPMEQAKFRKNLDNAASMVFHSRTGLPLTSSPAPVRRGKTCFDFDSSINSVSAIKSALFSSSFSTDDESESEGSIVSPCSPETYALPKGDFTPVKYRRKGHAANLLGSFEESVLNGRLEPVSTVHGFSAELGASGSFVPKHLVVPVTVFFYTLGDNDKVSSPYLSHINLGKKGYNVPKSGTVQVTLFNPLGTVVKMFVIMYDLSDMPPNSQTFIRQRTLYMPTNCKDENLEWGPKWLRYLIHLRFMSSKSGKIYLHSDIRMIIFRKSDMDTATAHGIDMCYELRSFTHMPTNPKFSPRK